MLNEVEALTVLTALAQETRFRIVRTLVAAFPRGVPAGQLAQSVGRAPATLTFHLQLLEQAGLVRSRREARSVIYTAIPARLINLGDGLMQGCCGGHPELCDPDIAERNAGIEAKACCGLEKS